MAAGGAPPIGGPHPESEEPQGWGTLEAEMASRVPHPYRYNRLPPSLGREVAKFLFMGDFLYMSKEKLRVEFYRFLYSVCTLYDS